MTIDLLAVGHCARDEFAGQEGWRLGGSALYAAATAAKLGARVALVTRVGPTERPILVERCRSLGIALHALEGNVTTTFAFRYHAGGGRTLRLRARARAIAAADVPTELHDAPAVVFGSIVHEVGPGLLDAFPAAVRVLVAQGELRTWAADGTVGTGEWGTADEELPRVSAVVLSEEDLRGDLGPAERWALLAPVVVTLAERGARVFARGGTFDVAGFRAAAVVDPTGAGDAFAAGLAIALQEGRSLAAAARFANAVASFAVEAAGTAGLADRAGVEARLGTSA